MSDRVAFARLDHDNEAAELRRELGVVTDERDTALTDVARLAAERDRAREECGHEKAMRAGQYKELMYHVGYLRDARAERDALSAVIDKVREWVMVNEIAAVPLDWAGLGAILNPLAAGLAAPVGETATEVVRAALLSASDDWDALVTRGKPPIRGAEWLRRRAAALAVE